ncbi:uncharacterized protein PAE49_009373 [Odontesthes bonariensis]|uniref:uncharacterized protein LOC142385367 n=1 Tax=Odontesthes bonariensis TaxID=219752 RepID=UPI003F5871ED
MANGQVEIHDPISNHGSRTHVANSEPKTTSNTDNMEDSVEFRILMAYAKRRRSKKEVEAPPQRSPVALVETNGTTPSPTKTETEEAQDGSRTRGRKSVKKKGWKRLALIFKCVKPQTENEDEQEPEQKPKHVEQGDENLHFPENDLVKGEDKLEKVAGELAGIADEIQFFPPDVETDSEDDDVEKIIGLLLRESGDRLNERMMEAKISPELFFDYSFYRTLMNTFLTRIGFRSANADDLGPQASPKTQIAVTCEITSRLSAVYSPPTSHLLHHGARYLQDYYSAWAQQQGGYEATIESEEDEVE